LLNSKLTQWRFKLTSTNNNVGTNELETLPFRFIDFSDQKDKAAHDRMVTLVERMLELHKQLAVVRTPQEKTALERQITATDAQIDRLVYDLYGLTDAETEIVEGRADTSTVTPAEAVPESKPKRARRKSAYASPPPAPVHATLTPEKAYADAAHHYGKEEPAPYRTITPDAVRLPREGEHDGLEPGNRS
jgi:hypothetical protein